MKEQLVSFELAKKLKEVGFDLECEYAWDENNGQLETYCDEHFCNKETDYNMLSAPTLSHAQKWFREKKDIEVVICIWIDTKYWFEILNRKDLKTDTLNESDPDFKTYEEALEAGLLKACAILSSYTEHDNDN